MYRTIFDKIDNSEVLTRQDIVNLLKIEDKSILETLFEKAYQVKLDHVGNKVRFRGLIELSNICRKNCYYCGIRKDNKSVNRYMMKESEIMDAAMETWQSGYGSLVLQAGEQQSELYTAFIEKILIKIKAATNNELGITLSLGEQSLETYERWRKAGAHRYLLRIESSNEELFGKLHPECHNFSERTECIENLRSAGYQVGTGVMIGLPFQTLENLADDIKFFSDMDVDMIGMGPYLVQDDTPIAEHMPDFSNLKERQLNLGLKMIAICRIVLKDINIASTTALQTLHPKGRELGLLAGANVIMPNVSETKYRADYSLYNRKPSGNENNGAVKRSLQESIEKIGEKIAFNEWGDSPHFKKRVV